MMKSLSLLHLCLTNRNSDQKSIELCFSLWNLNKSQTKDIGTELI